MTKKIPKVSIIVPTYNRKSDLVRLLTSIKASDYPVSQLEIVIVDNAANLSRSDLTKVTGSIPLKLEFPGNNLFCSGGRSYGAQKASGDLFFFIDDDNILSPDCISKLVSSFDEVPKLGVVAPLMLFYRDKKRIWAAGVKLNKFGRPIYIYGNKYLEEVDMPETITGMDCFPNAFMVKRQVLDEVPFDIAHFPHNWSEADFGLRVKQHGYVSLTNTSAREWHDIDYNGLTTRTDRVKIYDQTKSRVLFRRRFFHTFMDWVVFWGLTMPVSSLYYVKAIMNSPDKNKMGMVHNYIKGTLDGLKAPIKADVDKEPGY